MDGNGNLIRHLQEQGTHSSAVKEMGDHRMTLFTEGRLQAYERMMRDNGNYHRGRSDGKSHRTDNSKIGASRKDFGKAGKKHAGIQS